ncbi:MAG: phage tail tape measure protein, partial [Bacteroidetes bacterium]|nr:phage tail tape measure protein [Bacteroidota bacterium]
MSKFVLTAQIKLQAPTNTSQIVNQIRSQLQGITATIGVTVPRQTTQALQSTVKQVKNVGKAVEEEKSRIVGFGEASALAAKRFLAFAIAGRSIMRLAQHLGASVKEAITFERQMNKVAQVTDRSNMAISALTDEISRLGINFGVSSSELAQSSLLLAQTGMSAEDTTTALEALAKSSLAPTFTDMVTTTQGAIAVFRQFGVEAKDLEGVLGTINAVSAAFAVESNDLVAAIRRTGGAFEAAGGDLNQLIALFTSVRSTTRESAESIATGFRTIFTRMQRLSTGKFLSNFGIELRDLEGQFVGPFEAVRRLSTALNNLEGTDPRFSAIIEELGGFRQVSKVVPLIQQFETAQKAYNVALAGSDSLTADVVKAQESLAVQVQKTREQFAALIRTIVADTSFKSLIKLGLKMAGALTKVTEALLPLLPLFVAFASIAIGKSISPYFQGVKNKIMGVGHHAEGGFISGTGNQDTVPAMLTPGEFVIRKDAVKSIGVGNLARMNRGGAPQYFAEGGPVSANYTTVTRAADPEKVERGKGQQFGAIFLSPGESDVRKNPIIGQIEEGVFSITANEIKGFSVPIKSNFIARSFSQDFAKKFGTAIETDLVPLANKLTNQLSAELSASSIAIGKGKDIINYESIIGNLWETALRGIGTPFIGDRTGFDFPTGVGPELAKIFGIPGNIPTDAKKVWNTEALNSISDKIFTWYKQNYSIYRSTFAPTGRPKTTADQQEIKLLNSVRDRFAVLQIGQEVTTKMLSNIKHADGTPVFADRIISSPGLLARKTKSFGINLTTETRGYTKKHIYRGLDVPEEEREQYHTGGLVGGFGNRDTVPAALTPGEFVIRKEAVEQIGAGNLAKMNRGGIVQRFAKAGTVRMPFMDIIPEVRYHNTLIGELLNDPVVSYEFQKRLNLNNLKFIGSGIEALTFQDVTTGHAIRLTDDEVKRAKLSEMLQAIKSEVFRIEGRQYPYTIEHLPFRPSLVDQGKTSIASVEYKPKILELEQRVTDVGYIPSDVKFRNVTELPTGDLQLIDPGAITPSPSYISFEQLGKKQKYQKGIDRLASKYDESQLRQRRRQAGIKKQFYKPSLDMPEEKAVVLERRRKRAGLYENILIAAIRQKLDMQGFALGGMVSKTGAKLLDIYPSLKHKINPKQTYSATVVSEAIGLNDTAVLNRMIENKRQDSELPNWLNFEMSLAQVRGLFYDDSPQAFLDYPKKPGDAKFLRQDEGYQTVQGKGGSGNNNETMLGKLVGAGVYKPRGTNVITAY